MPTNESQMQKKHVQKPKFRNFRRKLAIILTDDLNEVVAEETVILRHVEALMVSNQAITIRLHKGRHKKMEAKFMYNVK